MRRRFSLSGSREKAVLVCALVMLMLAIFVQSYNGRRDVVRAERADCARSGASLAALVNEQRDAQTANLDVSRDPSLSPLTRRARALQARELDGTIVVEDSHIDQGLWASLAQARDQRRVRRSTFRCRTAFPAASLVQFFS